MFTLKRIFILFISLVTVTANQLPLPSHLLATSPEPPFVEIPGIKSSYNALIASDTLNLLAARLQFSLTITHPPDFLFGGFKNGQWDGIVGQLLRKEADMGASLNAITYARYTAVDFSVPVIYDVTGILIPFPDETSKIMAAFLPFSIEVWIAFISSTFLVYFTLLIEGKINSSRKKFGDHAMWVVGIITGQGVGYNENRLGLRLAAATWCLTMVVFIYVYTGVLTALLAVPNYVPIINTLDELATSSTIKPVTIKSTAVDDIMLNAKNGTYKLIGDTFRKYPNETLVANTLIGVQRAVEGKYGFLEPRMSLLSLMENDRKEHNSCRVTLAKQTFYPRAFAYFLPKKSPFKDAFDRQILLMQQYGFIIHFQTKIVLQSNRCLLLKKKVRSRPPIFTLNHVSSSFVILVFGYAVSFLCFIFENMWNLIDYLYDF
ncbi:glutamate receptor ionotropic, delta-1-like isoform X2 [Daphnia pulex]|uniref:glutamate receptor ionotropic, delta-1-like isoform X2 n=1 Tax=Daphnia pulex TaxID=6669 RepID=UPI001EDF6724|nr:glutamate receptor ionotropic, delta-1-like isoform X2 [Daphnia pulex]